MNTRFTSGPWTWHQGETDHPGQWSLSPGILMADENDGTPGGDARDRANARLIAAAPELFEALEGAVHAFEMCGLSGGGLPQWKALLARVRGNA